MTETSWWWDGHATGDAVTNTPYDMDQWAVTNKIMLTPDPDNQGVVGGILNSLAITYSSASVVTVDSGAAIVNGRLYYNDSKISINLSGALSYWIVGLLMDTNTYSVRVFSRGGYADSATALSTIAHFVDYWEMPLAIISLDTSGLISSINDRRLFVLRPMLNSDFVPAISGYDTTSVADLVVADERGILLADAHYVYGFGSFIVPNNFWKILTIKPIVIPANSGSVRACSYIEYGSFHASEDFNTHNVATGFITTAVTANHASILHVTLPLNDLEIGLGAVSDFLCLTTVRNGADLTDTINGSVYLSGWLVEYAILF